MITTKQTVYLPVKVEDELPDKNYSDELHSDCGLVGFENGVFGKWDNNKGIWNYPIKVRTWLKSQEAFVFTPEQLNEYTQTVIKQTLETAAENIEFIKTTAEKLNSEEYKPFITADNNTVWTIDKQSITNTFEEMFKRFTV